MSEHEDQNTEGDGMNEKRIGLALDGLSEVLNAAGKSTRDVAEAVDGLGDDTAALALAMLACLHETNARGGKRYVPELGLAALVMAAADQLRDRPAGERVSGVYSVIPAFADRDVRHCLAELAWRYREQRKLVITAALTAEWN
jgi:hypothetical protein